MRRLRTKSLLVAGLAGILTLPVIPAICHAQDAPTSSDTGYGYVSTSEGGVTLLESDTGEFVAVEGAEAILAGDELRLSSGALAEVRLADRNVLRLGDRAEVAFHTLAASPDRADPTTTLQLRRGAMQILVADDFRGESPPIVETDNAWLELRGPGAYLIEVSTERTVLAVRRGGARVRGPTGFTTLRAGEEAVIEGLDGSRILVSGARRLASVERWGEGLTARGSAPAEVYVEEPVRYASAYLSGYGNWVHVRGTWAWRPRVGYDWRPYWHGRWRHTPTGLLWVSYEPWGWVPHHYGSWDLVPGYGWVWFPGRRFASAWVFWYWGPEYVGWIPWGYYSRHYGSRYHLTHGVYGWAGGLTVRFGDWCFTPYRWFGHRHQHRYLKSGRALGRERERMEPGVITTDTRGLTPGHWTTPDRVTRLLTYDPDRGEGRDLDDVTPFIYREKDVRIPDGWEPPRENRLADRGGPLVHPVRGTPFVTAGGTGEDVGRAPSGSVPRDGATREPMRTASIDPVRTTRAVEVRREPTARETARREVRERASIDPVRATRTVEVRRGPGTSGVASPSRPAAVKTPERSPSTRSGAVERVAKPAGSARPNAGARPAPKASPTRSAPTPPRAGPTRAAPTRAAPARTGSSRATPRGASGSKGSKIRPD